MVSHAPPPEPLYHWGKTRERKEGKNGEMEGGEKKDDVRTTMTVGIAEALKG